MDALRRIRKRALAPVLVALLALPLAGVARRTMGGDRPLSVYVTRVGDPAADAAVRSALEGDGMTVTMAPPLHLWDGTQGDLSRFDAVVLLNSANWASDGMTAASQRSLVRYAALGGGVVTGEWLLWNVFRSGYEAGLAPMLPASTASYLATGRQATYTRAEPDPVMDRGLPESLNFPTNDIFGSESVLTPRNGAHVFYSSENGQAAGVVGWDYRAGRVVCFSSFISDAELADPNYRRLVANAVRWTKR